MPPPNNNNPNLPQRLQDALDAGIWYSLCLWPALDVAIRESWGGPDSGDKRDWFAGEVSQLLTSRPTTDHDDVVVFLLQVMQDEFECDVEDDSEEEVARSILAVRTRVLVEGDLGVVGELEQRWRSMGQVKVEFGGQMEDEGEGESDEDEADGEEEDQQPHDEAPKLVRARAKAPREIDDDGFEKVTGRRGR